MYMVQKIFRMCNSFLVVGLMSLTILACAGPRMVPPAEVTDGCKTMEVQNRSSATGAMVNESFGLGTFQVTDVDRKWNKKSNFNVGGYGANKTKTGYSFLLKASGTWEGSCASVRSEKGVDVGVTISKQDSTLICECKQGTNAIMATLTGSSEKMHDQGEIQMGELNYPMPVIKDTDKSNFTGRPGGYRIDKDGAFLAAVEVLRPGRVWLKNEVEVTEEEALSCIFAGLMLYEPPSDR
jgi:hypothetical protein